jgi:hypothetical protein
MRSIVLNTAYRRKTKDGLKFADAGEVLIVGTEISATDAAKLVERGAAEEQPVKGKAA